MSHLGHFLSFVNYETVNAYWKIKSNMTMYDGDIDEFFGSGYGFTSGTLRGTELNDAIKDVTREMNDIQRWTTLIQQDLSHVTTRSDASKALRVFREEDVRSAARRFMESKREELANSTGGNKSIGKVDNPLPTVRIEEPKPHNPTREGRRFKIGERYILYAGKNKKYKREYVVKKTIYTIQDRTVRIVIMKQVSGFETTRFTLNKNDCLKFHIKYEPGLEVFSMELDWKLVRNK